MTEKQFRINLTRAIAEDDRDLCECCKCGASDLTNEGIGIIADIVMAQVEPLFIAIAELEVRVGDERAHWTMTNESGVLNG